MTLEETLKDWKNKVDSWGSKIKVNAMREQLAKLLDNVAELVKTDPSDPEAIEKRKKQAGDLIEALHFKFPLDKEIRDALGNLINAAKLAVVPNTKAPEAPSTNEESVDSVKQDEVDDAAEENDDVASTATRSRRKK